jgi:hypothetical protein
MSDFPRGWTFNTISSLGGTAGLIIPAPSNIGRVLDGFTVGVANFGNTSTAYAPRITVTVDGGLPYLTTFLACQPIIGTRDSNTFSGLNLCNLFSAAITYAIVIQFSVGNPGNYFEEITAQGHDIA